MRDPKRIPKMLNELKGVWSTFPDLRLGQLLLNVAERSTLYYMEYDELMKKIRQHYSEAKYFENNQSNIQD